jgi:hypothetical protein
MKKWEDSRWYKMVGKSYKENKRLLISLIEKYIGGDNT